MTSSILNRLTLGSQQWAVFGKAAQAEGSPQEIRYDCKTFAVENSLHGAKCLLGCILVGLPKTTDGFLKERKMAVSLLKEIEHAEFRMGHNVGVRESLYFRPDVCARSLENF